MAERSRRARRQVSEITEDSPDVSEGESDISHVRGSNKQETSPVTSRSKRAASGNANHSSFNSPDGNKSIKLTMKVAPSKLREVMRVNEVDSLRDTLGGGQVLDGPRSRRSATQTRAAGGRSARTSYVEPRESDIDDEEEEGDDDEEEEEDAEADADADDDDNEDNEGDEDDDADGDGDTTMNDFDEVGAEAEGGTDEEMDMAEQASAAAIIKKNQMPPKGPKITIKTPSKKSKSSKPSIVVTPASVGKLQSVEDQEMEDDDDDEGLDEDSELPDVGDETNLDDTNMGGDTELGEDEGDEDEEELDDDDDGLGDSDDDELASGTATPDPSKMTSRQRGKAIEPLMALDMAPQQRKFFTEEEKAMKKDEHARKRKELTKRKTQEEKTAALNRLLKPQVSKSRGAAPKAETLAAQMQAAAEEADMVQKADPLYTRWISNKEGVTLGVPEEWLGKKVGQYFGSPLPQNTSSLVREVE